MLIAELKNHLLLSYNCALCNSFGANENETTIKQIITHVRHYNAFSHITHPRDWHNYQRRAISALCDLPQKKNSETAKRACPKRRSTRAPQTKKKQKREPYRSNCPHWIITLYCLMIVCKKRMCKRARAHRNPLIKWLSSLRPQQLVGVVGGSRSGSLSR